MITETIYNFSEQLSIADSKEGKLDRIYHKYFKNVVSIETIKNETRQHNGIDRQITLQSGEVVTTQEKWRPKWKFSNDFLIEYCSVWKNGKCVKPGWIYSISSNYVFMVFELSQKVLIYPVVQLKLAWDEHEKEWLEKYPKRVAHNWEYDTLNVPVPCDVLEEAIREKMQFNYQQTLFDFSGEAVKA